MKPLDIYKLLPKKNCGKCNHPTCLAFAMELAQLKEDPLKCPYIDDTAKSALLESSSTPVKEIKIKGRSIGGETVLFRHEKKFYNPCMLCFQFRDSWEDRVVDEKMQFFNSLKFERVGDLFKPEGVLIHCTDKNRTEALVKKLIQQIGDDLLLFFLGDFSNRCCVDDFDVFFFTSSNLQEKVDFSRSNKKVIVLSDNSVASLKNKIASLNNTDPVILNIYSEGKQQLDSLIEIRTKAVLDRDKSLGFPVISFPSNLLESSLHIMKYSSILVLPEILDAHDWLALFTLRQSIYSDPQKPLQVSPGIYQFNNATASSPLLVTCNLSLTFFIVKGDLESSKLPCNVLVVDTEGLSVLTAWAAGKFDADRIAKNMKKFDVENKASTRKLIIPGGLAPIKGDLEDLSKYSVFVGPSDSAQIGAFLRGFVP